MCWQIADLAAPSATVIARYSADRLSGYEVDVAGGGGVGGSVRERWSERKTMRETETKMGRVAQRGEGWDRET